MKTAAFLQPSMADTTVNRRDAGNLLHDVRTGPVGHGVSHPVSDIHDDFPICAGIARRFDHFVQELYPALRIGEGAVFLGEAGGGQDDVGQLAGFIDEQIAAVSGGVRYFDRLGPLTDQADQPPM